MISGRDIDTVLNHSRGALDIQYFTLTDRLVSKVITKQLCNYTNSFYR